MSIACPQCGHVGADDDRFCANCGAPLSAEAFESIEHTGSITSIVPGVSTNSGAIGPIGSGRQYDLPSGGALLLVLRGPQEGAEFVLDPVVPVVSVGRAPEAGIFLDDVTVSRHHAEFRNGAEGWSVRDAGSLNGTYVNRVRVDDQLLQGGDEVQIGKFRFVFLVGLDAA